MFRLFLTGAAMGAADVVPGVSGGTIAFISGIYFRLLNAIRAAPSAVAVLFKEGFAAAWAQIDGTFLAVLGSGIALSILSLARVISWLLANYPSAVWGFFFGLIIASCVYLGSQVRWRWQECVFLLVGIAIAIIIGNIRPTEIEATTTTVFFSGAIAICAMILPGISGSFILLIIGMYPTVINALKSFDLAFIAVFASGCLVGLLGFSHVLSYLITRFRGPVLALLTGFLAGSLAMVWPWQHVVESYEKSDGRMVALRTENLMPNEFAQLTGQDPYTLLVVGLMVFGVALVLLMSRLGPGEQSKET
ncbi:MAG: DUF368 domain-containing protein [Pseudomonadota bacterium]